MKTRRRNPVFSIVALSAVAGLLLWAKLRLVANIPRSVYADPESRQPEENRVRDSGPTDHTSGEREGQRPDDHHNADAAVEDESSSTVDPRGD